MQIWKGMVFLGQIHIWVLQFEEAASGVQLKTPEEKEEHMSVALITVT